MPALEAMSRDVMETGGLSDRGPASLLSRREHRCRQQALLSTTATPLITSMAHHHGRGVCKWHRP